MKKGMIFDLYVEGVEVMRVMSISSTDVINLKTLEVIKNIDFKNSVEKILILDVYKFSCDTAEIHKEEAINWSKHYLGGFDPYDPTTYNKG